MKKLKNDELEHSYVEAIFNSFEGNENPN